MPAFPPDDYLCPTCGRNVPVGRNCPCSRPKKIRKRKKKVADSIPWDKEYEEKSGLPEDNFDYDEFIAREFGEGPTHKQVGIALHWWITALILAIACFFYFVI